MLRTRLSLAVCAAALIASPALAQDAQPADEATQPTATAEPTADQTAAAAQGDVLDVLRERGGFETFLAAIEASGLAEVIEADPDITLFVPNDAAFAALPAGEVERLMEPANREALRQLLLYHVINADVRSEQLVNRRGEVETGSGQRVTIDGGGEQIRYGDATVLEADLRGSNGAVFVIDRVVMPGAAATAEPAAAQPAEAPVEAPGEEVPPAQSTPPVQTPDAGDPEATVPEA